MIANVSGANIRDAFSDIAPLKATTIKFSVHENILTVSAESNALYVSNMEILESSGLSNIEVCVQYTDVSPLIDSEDIVKIELSEFSVNLSTQSFHVVLAMSDSIIESVEVPSINTAMPISNTDLLNLALNSFRYISFFQKKLMTERPIQLCKDHAVIILPTVWLRVKSCDLEATLTKEQCSMISKFNPTHFLESDRLWLFKKSSAISFPIIPVDRDDHFLSMLDSMKSLGVYNSKDLASKTKRISKTLGGCECSVYVTNNDVFFRAQNANLELKDTIVGDVLYSYDTRLEYMETIFTMLGDDRQFEMLYKDNLMCFRNGIIGIILSVGGK